MQSTGHASAHAVSFVSMQGSAITYAITLHDPFRLGELLPWNSILADETQRKHCHFSRQTRTLADGVYFGPVESRRIRNSSGVGIGSNPRPANISAKICC